MVLHLTFYAWMLITYIDGFSSASICKLRLYDAFLYTERPERGFATGTRDVGKK